MENSQEFWRRLLRYLDKQEESQERNFLIDVASKNIDKTISKIVYRGLCVECKSDLAICDYNGNGHWVCRRCDRKLEREFEEDYN